MSKGKSDKPFRCLVLGGSGYVGSAVCELLAKNEVEVAFTYLKNQQRAEELTSAYSNCRSFSCDFNEPQQIKELVAQLDEEWGGIDGLVQCGGIAGNPDLYKAEKLSDIGAFTPISLAEWQEMMNITVQSTFLACQAVAPIMQKQKSGSIVVLSAFNALKAVPAPVHYAASKGALKTMVESLAKVLGDYNVTVNMVASGILEGGIGSLLSEQMKEEYVKHCSMQRVGNAEEIANVVGWLLIENTYVTGQSLLLDGGL